jgi:hypothetical protein
MLLAAISETRVSSCVRTSCFDRTRGHSSVHNHRERRGHVSTGGTGGSSHYQNDDDHDENEDQGTSAYEHGSAPRGVEVKSSRAGARDSRDRCVSSIRPCDHHENEDHGTDAYEHGSASLGVEATSPRAGVRDPRNGHMGGVRAPHVVSSCTELDCPSGFTTWRSNE